MAGLKTIAAPNAEPVTLTDIKPQLRIDTDDTDYDDILAPLIVAAREWCEQYQNRAYITQTLELALDCWPHGAVIGLPRPPMQSLTSLTYTDCEGVSASWDVSNLIVDDYDFVAKLVLTSNACWPSVTLQPVNGIKIRYVAGYGNAADVPQSVKQAITLLTIHWYENGMCDPPPAVLSLLSMDRVVPT